VVIELHTDRDMIGTPSDRRRRPRLKLPYSIVLHRIGEPTGIQTATEYISSDGFFCISEQPFSPNESLDCEVMIPSQDSKCNDGESLVLHCRAEVVRVVTDGIKPGYGLACRLKDYTVGRTILKQTRTSFKSQRPEA
jgi:PilZ domain